MRNLNEYGDCYCPSEKCGWIGLWDDADEIIDRSHEDYMGTMVEKIEVTYYCPLCGTELDTLS